jgi:O-antigen/teichoic acid export membrane protein
MKRSIFQLASIYLVGSVFGRGLFYGSNILLSRGLGAEALGIFAFGLSVVKIGGLLGNLGLDETVQRVIPEYRSASEEEKLAGLIQLAILVPVIVGSIVSGIFLHFRASHRHIWVGCFPHY